MSSLPRPTVLLGFVVTVVFIGLNFVAVRMSNFGLDPTWGATLRFAAASLLLFGYVAARRIPLPRGRALAGAVLYGTLFFAVFFGFAYWALVELPSATASVINATFPLIAFLGAVVVRLERFRWSALAGAVVVVGGVLVLVGSDATTPADLPRLLAMFAATVGASLGTVVVKWFPRNHPAATNAVGMGVATVLLLAVSALRGETWGPPADGQTWVILVYLIASSLLLFPLAVWVIGEWTVSASAYSVVLGPLVTIPVALWILSETVDWTFLAGTAIILAGVYVGALWHPRTPELPVAQP